jgi:hypothetical protein
MINKLKKILYKVVVEAVRDEYSRASQKDQLEITSDLVVLMGDLKKGTPSINTLNFLARLNIDYVDYFNSPSIHAKEEKDN